MAPSRGSADAQIDRESQSALTSLRRTFAYVVSPGDSSNRPSSLRLRLLLRTIRSLTIFIFWRVVRYAKYVAIGTISATAVGAVVGGPLGWLLAPTGIGASIIAGTVWGAGRWGVRRMERRYRAAGGFGGGKDVLEEEAERGTVYRREPGMLDGDFA